MTEQIDKALKREYEAGFVSDIESETFPKGLNEDVIRAISKKKEEPEFMLCASTTPGRFEDDAYSQAAAWVGTQIDAGRLRLDAVSVGVLIDLTGCGWDGQPYGLTITDDPERGTLFWALLPKHGAEPCAREGS